MSPLNKYVKPTPQAMVITSVNVRLDQLNFIHQNKLNLSQIVRDAIDKLIKGTQNEK